MIGVCIAVACGFFLLGYGLACFIDGDAKGNLEHELFAQEIENARLKRGKP